MRRRQNLSPLSLMRIKSRAGVGHRRLQNGPRLRFGDEQCFIVRAAEGHVGDTLPAARLNAIERLAPGAEQPRAAHADMRDNEIARRIHRHAIRPDSARQVREYADLGNAAVGRERHAPNAVAARGGDQQHLFVCG